MSVALAIGACDVGGIDDAEYDPTDVHEGDAEELSIAAGGGTVIRIAQLNPYWGGRFSPVDKDGANVASVDQCGAPVCKLATDINCWERIAGQCRKRTWQTAFGASGLINQLRVDVLGVQELSPTFVKSFDSILEYGAGGDPAAQPGIWDYTIVPNGVSAGAVVFWRTARVELVQGSTIDLPPGAENYIVKFNASVLRVKGATKTFGFFTGKLAWRPEESSTRLREAVELRRKIDATMSAFEGSGSRPRIVAADFNDTPDSGAAAVFADYDEGGATKPTVKSGPVPTKKIDYLLWADGPGGGGSRGFVGTKPDGTRTGRSKYFGSDHRFIYGDVGIP